MSCLFTIFSACYSAKVSPNTPVTVEERPQPSTSSTVADLLLSAETEQQLEEARKQLQLLIQFNLGIMFFLGEGVLMVPGPHAGQVQG